MGKIVQDEGLPVEYLFDVWDGLDESEKQSLYICAKIKDRRTSRNAFAVTLVTSALIILLIEGIPQGIYAVIPLIVSAGLLTSIKAPNKNRRNKYNNVVDYIK